MYSNPKYNFKRIRHCCKLALLTIQQLSRVPGLSLREKGRQSTTGNRIKLPSARSHRRSHLFIHTHVFIPEGAALEAAIIRDSIVYITLQGRDTCRKCVGGGAKRWKGVFGRFSGSS